MTTYWCENAWLPDDGATSGVVVRVSETGSAAEPGARTIEEISRSSVPPEGAVRLSGMVFPGFANAHSHAFHRALRGRTHRGGTFWSWREAMYDLAGRIDPDGYRKLATALYAEMALAGITSVGEFHYLHHAPEGKRYAEPNVMGEALIAAAADAGIRITLLDTLYLAGGLDRDGYRPVTGPQVRFSDGDIDAWSERVEAMRPRSHAIIGAGLHSVRAVPHDVMGTFAYRNEGLPVHLHLSEQSAENEACQAFHGMTPTELLTTYGFAGPWATAVHATHLSEKDIETLGRDDWGVCFCPSTEADLADGIGPARELVDAGCRLSLGSDQHVLIDPFAEARSLEFHERLRTGERGRFGPAELVSALTGGHGSLGWPAGELRVGRRADLVSIRLDSVRTAGCAPDQVVMAASPSDVDTVVIDGATVVSGGAHQFVAEPGRLLVEAIEEVWR